MSEASATGYYETASWTGWYVSFSLVRPLTQLTLLSLMQAFS